MELTTEQVLLLNNLMYMDGGSGDDPLSRADQHEGQTIGEWLNSIDVDHLQDATNYGSYMTGKDWKNIIGSVQADDTLKNMKIATTHTDWAEGGGGGFSAVFTSEETQNAVVAFRGTASREWKDDFIGGNMVETPQQKNALEWYQQVYQEQGLSNYEVTVTGHSKGGNKSKYITLLDDTVDHCVSFDGQGFSDKFINQYADQIAANQGKIENHNADYDYVNILLSDVGEKTYYTGQDLGEGGFLENHCPNTYMKYGEDGQFVLEVSPSGQGKEMQALDSFLNSYLRSMPDKDRTQALEMLGTLVENGFNMKEGSSAQDFTDMLKEIITDPKYSDDLAYLLAYTIKYEQTHPEIMGDVKSVLNDFGMGDIADYVDIAENVLNFDLEINLLFGTYHIDFNTVMSIVTGALSLPGVNSDWLLGKVCDWIEGNTGIRLSPADLRSLLGILDMVSDDLQEIKIKDNGEDLEVRPGGSSSGSYGRPCRIQCKLPAMRRNAKNLEQVKILLSETGDEVETLANSLSFHVAGAADIKKSLHSISTELRKRATAAGRLSEGLTSAAELYESTENKNVTILSS